MPPFCPKTEDEFKPGETQDFVYLVTSESDCSRFDVVYGFNRRLLARYQAVAWEDRRRRWERVLKRRGSGYMFRTGINHPLWGLAVEAKVKCTFNMRHWREWGDEAEWRRSTRPDED